MHAYNHSITEHDDCSRYHWQSLLISTSAEERRSYFYYFCITLLGFLSTRLLRKSRTNLMQFLGVVRRCPKTHRSNVRVNTDHDSRIHAGKFYQGYAIVSVVLTT